MLLLLLLLPTTTISLTIPLRIPTQERRLGVILLELHYLLQPLLLDEDSQRPAIGDFHNVGLEVVIGESEIEISLWILLNAGNEIILEEVITEQVHVLGGVLVGRHGLVQAVVIVEVVLLPLLPQTHGQLRLWLHYLIHE